MFERMVNIVIVVAFTFAVCCLFLAGVVFLMFVFIDDGGLFSMAGRLVGGFVVGILSMGILGIAKSAAKEMEM